MFDVNEYEKTINRFEKSLDEIERSLRQAQDTANGIHEKDLKPAVAKERLEALRISTLGAHRNSLAAVEIVGEKMMAELEENFSSDAVMRRAHIGNATSVGGDSQQRLAFAARLQAGSDDDVIGWAHDAAAAGNYAALDEIRRVARGRSVQVAGTVNTVLAEAGPPPETQAAQRLIERASTARMRAGWYETRARRLEGGKTWEQAAGQSEDLTLATRRIQAQLDAAGE